MNFSCSALVKSSACQIFYLRDKVRKRNDPNERMVEGNKFAESQSKSKLVEMQGLFKKSYGNFYYSFDEIRKIGNKLILIEYKQAEEDDPEWYRNSSIIQTAFQGSMLQASLHREEPFTLNTANYCENNNTLPVSRNNELVFKLNMGGRVDVVEFNPFPILQFYMTKARATRLYKTSKQFDITFKHKEWEYLKEHIKIRRVKR